MACPYNSKSNNLEQGLLYRSNEDRVKKDNNKELDLLQATSGPWGSSPVEEFIGSATQIPLDRALAGRSSSPVVPPPPMLKLDLNTPGGEGSDLQKLEGQFNGLLAKYTQQYKLMSEELVHNNNQTVLQKYANNNVKLNNAFYYVNSHGFASKYDQDAWKNRSVSCSREPVEISSEDFKKLLKGPPMGKGQACNVAGFNIRGEDGWTGWVDVKGMAHHYPTPDIWKNRNQSCTMNALDLTTNEVQAMPKGDDMTQNTFCERMNVDPKILQSLANLNNQMLTLGNQIMAETEKLAGTDAHLNAQLKKAQLNLQTTLNKLQNSQEHADPFSHDTYFGHGTANINRTLEGAARSSEIFLRMNYLKYLVGLISVILLVILSFRAFASDTVPVASMVVLVLVIIFVLYNSWNYIYRKFL